MLFALAEALPLGIAPVQKPFFSVEFLTRLKLDALKKFAATFSLRNLNLKLWGDRVP
jgi:hypothetical protein